MRQWLAERAGRNQAEREIGFISSGYRIASDLWSELPHPKLTDAGGRNPFARAYYGRWYDEGYRDALKGKSRSALFEQRDYDYGWLEGMKFRQKQGFNNQNLESELNRIRSLRES